MVTVLAAQVPSTPSAPETTYTTSSVVISWQPTDNGGSDILSYLVSLKGKNGQFIDATSLCDTRLPTNLICRLSFEILQNEPFGLEVKDKVVAKV